MKKYIIFILLLLGVYYFKDSILQSGANFLNASQPNPPKADVLIVLGGEMEGERTELAVQLYKQGVAPNLLFSDGTHLSWRTKAVDEMTALAKKLGVSDDHIFTEEQSRSTYENATYTKEILAAHQWKSAVVVTTDWHTRRSKYIFDKVYKGSNVQLSYAGAKDKVVGDLTAWWKDGEKQQVVLTEWAKLIVYWLKY